MKTGRRWKGQKKEKKNLPQATGWNCNTLHSKTISSLHKCVLLFLFFKLKTVCVCVWGGGFWLKRCSHYHSHSWRNFWTVRGRCQQHLNAWRHMSLLFKEHVQIIPLILESKKKKKNEKGAVLLLASTGCVICWGHLRSPVAALPCSSCQRWCWNRCVPHPGLCWNQLQSGTMWQMIPI